MEKLIPIPEKDSLFQGKFRNRLGVELHTIEPYISRGVIGCVWRATIPDEVFGATDVLVTPGGLRDSGYQQVVTDNG